MIKVITYGTYDLLHHGHIRMLERAKALGDYLIVGITSDDYDKTRGKINNHQTLIERVSAVKATCLADEIIVEEYDGQKIEDIISHEVDIFTVGSDWEGHFDYLSEYCKVIYLPRTEGISSTEIRSKKGEIRVKVIGDSSVGDKFIDESKYVNGVTASRNMDFEDAVYVVSSPYDHYQHVKEALNAGKHVLCESPVAMSKAECDELLCLADKKNLVLMECIKTAYLTAYKRCVLLALSGKIGDILSIDVTCTSMKTLYMDNEKEWNSLSAWGPTALLPIFQILGTAYTSRKIVSWFSDESEKFDGFSKIDFTYPNAVASIKVAKAAKSEGSLTISGTNGYIYVPAPWWKTDYFEIRYEENSNNKRYFYQFEGEGLRYEIVEFSRKVAGNIQSQVISRNITREICDIMHSFCSDDVIRIRKLQ